MSIFDGYFDESGMHEGGTLGPSPVVVVAGFIAKTDQWAKFSDEWQGALDRYGIGYFHMADFNGGYKQFDTLGKDKKDILIDNLTRIMTIRAQVGIVAYFHVDDYEAVINEMPESYHIPKYTICSLACMNTVFEWGREYGCAEPIPYIFDRGAPYSGQFKEAYDLHLKYYTEQSKEWLFGSFVLEDKKRFKPLQAADVLAYWSYRRHYNEAAQKPIRIKYPLPKLLDIPIVEKRLDIETLRRLFVAVNQV